jgi:hypothetical protein
MHSTVVTLLLPTTDTTQDHTPRHTPWPRWSNNSHATVRYASISASTYSPSPSLQPHQTKPLVPYPMPSIIRSTTSYPYPTSASSHRIPQIHTLGASPPSLSGGLSCSPSRFSLVRYEWDSPHWNKHSYTGRVSALTHGA